VNRIVTLLLKQDYVSGIFVDDALEPVAGALPLSAINLTGSANTPRPAIVVNFRSFDTGCGNPLICSAVIVDTPRLTGHGEHGSFSRAETSNFMAAIGPDFKRRYQDAAPASNADVSVTIARILHLHPKPNGKQIGRVLEESMLGGPASVDFKRQTVRSSPAEGLVTVLNTQRAGDTVYLDSARFESAR
jgi:hypothetical protein